jgi:hypothetical protein
VIVLLAARYPATVGLMLTFPALNGFAFIFSQREDLGRLTASMLWMPLLNGGLCTAYLAAFIVLAAPGHTTALAWWLAAGAALLWVVLAALPLVRRGVAPHRQWHYAAAVTLAGVVLTLVWWHFVGPTAPATAGAEAAVPPAKTLMKIALFTLALAVLVVVPPLFRLSASVSGILSGLPLVSIASLVSIAADAAIDLELRRALFMQMMLGVWLAPAMAVAFIFGTSRVLAAARAHRLRAVVVVTGWLLCGLGIAATGAALRWLSSL